MSTDHLVMRLGAGRYALPAHVVTRLVPPMPLGRVPGVPSWVAGLGDLRGRIVPVLDLRQLLGAASAPWPSSARVVACALPDGDARPVDVGLLADEVLGLEPVLEAAVRPLPAGMVGHDDALLRGLLPGPPPVAVLDPRGLLALRDRLGPG